MSLYDELGVGADASLDDIKTAYKTVAFRYHPDINPGAGEEGRKRFVAATEAFQVLRDDRARAEYDRLLRVEQATRQAGRAGDWQDADGAAFRRAAATGAAGSKYRQAHRDPLDDLFEQLFRNMGATEFHRRSEERADRERASAERRAADAAWKLEKEEAVEVKARNARVRARAETARAARHAATLRTLWQTHPGIATQDVVVALAFLAGAAALAFQWKTHMASVAAATGGSQT